MSKNRVVILLTDAQVEAVENYMFDARKPNRSAAITELINLGLESLKDSPPAVDS